MKVLHCDGRNAGGEGKLQRGGGKKKPKIIMFWEAETENSKLYAGLVMIAAVWCFFSSGCFNVLKVQVPPRCLWFAVCPTASLMGLSKTNVLEEPQYLHTERSLSLSLWLLRASVGFYCRKRLYVYWSCECRQFHLVLSLLSRRNTRVLFCCFFPPRAVRTIVTHPFVWHDDSRRADLLPGGNLDGFYYVAETTWQHACNNKHSKH